MRGLVEGAWASVVLQGLGQGSGSGVVVWGTGKMLQALLSFAGICTWVTGR